jgi:hypothetical protein
MKVLAASDTASPQEIQAIIDQVNETITVAQHQMITDMKLTRQDMVTVMQDQGLGFQQGQRGGFSGTPQAGQDQGGFPGGGFEGAPEGMPGGGFEGVFPGWRSKFDLRAERHAAGTHHPTCRQRQPHITVPAGCVDQAA